MIYCLMYNNKLRHLSPSTFIHFPSWSLSLSTNSKTWNGYGIFNELMRISRQTLSYQVLEASLFHLYRPSCHHVNFRLSSLPTTRLLASFTVFFLFKNIATKCWFSENRLIENPIRNPLGNSSAIQLNEMSPSVDARFRPVFISKV